MFTETDGIFYKPQANEIVPLNKEYTLRWNPKLLTHYSLKYNGLATIGDIVQCSHVEIELIGELLHFNGTIKNINVFRNFTVYSNTGRAKIVFPPSISGDRFYLNVIDKNNSDVRGWSSGYFNIHGSQNSTLKAFFKTKSITPRPLVFVANSSSSRRKLQSCTGATVTTNAYVTGGMVGIGCYLGSYPTPSTLTQVPLVSPSSNCIPTPVPTPWPTQRPPTLKPTLKPISPPTFQPTLNPTPVPPTFNPTPAPPTFNPTSFPTSVPTAAPSTTFSCTGSMQQYTVPSNTYGLLVNMTGGSGSIAGGLGGFISCKITVTPNQILYVNVGCAGSSNTGGYNGGGNGITSSCQSGGGGTIHYCYYCFIIVIIIIRGWSF